MNIFKHYMYIFRKQIEKSVHLYNRRKNYLYSKGAFSFILSNKGYVLVVVMVITTMLISVSSDFLLNAQVNINYMKKFRDEARAETLAYAGMNLAEEILKADMRGMKIPLMPNANSNKLTDTYKDIWALDFPVIELETGSLKIIIDDEQSKINVSALSTLYVDRSPFFGILNRFFINMGFPQDYTEAVLDWVDKDDTKTGNGAETYDFYSTLPEPYQAANSSLDSIDQLLLIKYFTPEIYYGFGGGNSEEEKTDESITLVDSNSGIEEIDIMSLLDEQGDSGDSETENANEDDEEVIIGPERSRRLDDYLRAHGDSRTFNSNINKININTASYRVILSLSDDMDPQKAKEIITKRQTTPFTKVKELENYISDETLRKNCITVNSDLFRITCIGTVNNHFVKITGIYNRKRRKYYYYSIQ